MKSPNPPERHHYIPKFMLKGWVDPETSKLFCYTHPYPGKVVGKQVVTKAVGFKDNIYELPGVPDEHAQIIETEFFQHIDNDAAVVHSLLTGGRIKELTSKQKVSWVRFIMAMMFRTPRNLKAYQDGFKGAWEKPTPDTTTCYQSMWQIGMPLTEEEYIAQYHPGLVDHIVMREFPRFVQNTQVSQHILGMRWHVLHNDRHPFLISDEPVVMQAGLAKPGGHLAMPLTANWMFLATYDESTFKQIKRVNPDLIVKAMNKLLVQRASQFVGARDAELDIFIKKHFGTKPADTIATLFAAKFGSSK